MAVLRLTADMLAKDPASGRLTLDAAKLPPPAVRAPVVNTADGDPAAARVRMLFARGQAAGLAGVLYDNRDRGHSELSFDAFPQLTRVVYGPELKARQLDYGLAGAFRFPAIVLGNSSTALVRSPQARSQARLAMTQPGGAARAAEDYFANALYCYPEHHDHDRFDYFPAAWPYMTVSQGSSYSDQPFLRIQALILAAFRPDTRARMERLGLVAPTVQWVMRRTQKGLRGAAAYMSGAAHPSAFAGAALNPVAAVALAASLAPDEIPPAPRLAVLSEDFGDRAGLAGLSERLFDTPAAIARLWRSLAGRHEITLTAANTRDPAGRALQFHWVLLRGDPQAVRILTQGAQARIVLDWQSPRPAPAGFGTKGQPPVSARIDIGLFAQAGRHLSAPAFLSVTLPPEARSYDFGPGGIPRLASVNYDAPARRARYDPVLFWWAPWHDDLQYNASGRLTGWTRTPTLPTAAAARAAGRYRADGSRDGSPARYALGPLADRRGRELGWLG
ncbi:hypothetical protein U879_14135 [Defluviimonas sp. 20V17]|nr:hypothetical protein [Allgaiera indica]KDB02997.1 hypothetical protein U879_14135 [Defluviimonas sp. 20V17]